MEEEAPTASKEGEGEEEEEENRWQPRQWLPGSVGAAGAPVRLLSEEDLKPEQVEFESMEAARDAIRNFCWSKRYPFYVRQSDPRRYVIECPHTMKKKVKKNKMGDGEGEGHVAGQTNEEMNEEVAGQRNEEMNEDGRTNEDVSAGWTDEVAGQTNEEMNEDGRTDEDVSAGRTDEDVSGRTNEDVPGQVNASDNFAGVMNKRTFLISARSYAEKEKRSCRYYQGGPEPLLWILHTGWHEGVGGYIIRHSTGTWPAKGCTECGSCPPPDTCTQTPRCPCQLHGGPQGKKAT